MPTQDQFQNVTWTEELYFYSVTGKKLGTYSLSGDQSPVLAQTSTNVWFGGRLVRRSGSTVAPDRLGSIGKYYPYGQEKGSGNPANGVEKFATYTRDAETGLDYADQRYHSPGAGRFMSADRYRASGAASDPASWNRYAYVGGDPLGFIDPSGEFKIIPGACDVTKYWATNFDGPGVQISILTCSYTIEYDASDGPRQTEKEAPSDEERRDRKVSKRFEGGLKAALNALSKKDCLSTIFPNATVDPWTVLSSVVQGKEYGYVQTNAIDPATTNGLANATTQRVFPNQTPVDGGFFNGFAGGLITINTLPGTTFGSDSYSDADRGATLIHELGHLFNIPGLSSILGGSTIPDDGPGVPEGNDLSRKNTERIRNNCFK